MFLQLLGAEFIKSIIANGIIMFLKFDHIIIIIFNQLELSITEKGIRESPN